MAERTKDSAGVPRPEGLREAYEKGIAGRCSDAVDLVVTILGGLVPRGARRIEINAGDIFAKVPAGDRTQAALDAVVANFTAAGWVVRYEPGEGGGNLVVFDVEATFAVPAAAPPAPAAGRNHMVVVEKLLDALEDATRYIDQVANCRPVLEAAHAKAYAAACVMRAFGREPEWAQDYNDA